MVSGRRHYAVRFVTASVLMWCIPCRSPFRGSHGLIVKALSVRGYVMGVRVGCGQCLAGSMPAFTTTASSAHMMPSTWENPEFKQLLGPPGQLPHSIPRFSRLEFSS